MHPEVVREGLSQAFSLGQRLAEPDLLVLDQMLPDEDGSTIVRSLRERPEYQDIPVLFVTGHPPDNAEALAIGCLVKPYTEKTLRAALDAVDLHISGKACKPPKGLQLYPIKRPG